MKKSNTHEIDIDVDALKYEDPDMYECLFNVFVEEGADRINFYCLDSARVVNYRGLKEAVSRIKSIRCNICMDGNFAITAEVTNNDFFFDGVFDYKSGTAYDPHMISLAHISDMSRLLYDPEMLDDESRVYEYIVDRAGLEIRNSELVEKLISDEVLQ